MSLKVSDRIRENTITIGSGVLILTGNNGPFKRFTDVLLDNDVTYYCIEENDSFEVGIGTYNTNTLSRDLVLQSTQNGEKINLAGSGAVFITYPADKSVFKNQQDRIPVGPSGIIFNDNTIQTTAPVKSDDFLYVSGVANYASGVSSGFSSYVNIENDFIAQKENHKIFANSTSNEINVYIPTASGIGGKDFVIKKTGGQFLVNLIPTGIETIDGNSSYSIFNEYQSVTITSNNTNWLIT